MSAHYPQPPVCDNTNPLTASLSNGAPTGLRTILPISASLKCHLKWAAEVFGYQQYYAFLCRQAFLEVEDNLCGRSRNSSLELGELALAYSELIGTFFLFDTHFA